MLMLTTVSLNEWKKERRWDTAMEWNCLRLYFKWFVTLRYYWSHWDNLRVYSFSIFVLFLLSETTESIKRRFTTEIETDPYKRRLNRVQNVCRQYGLAPENDNGESHSENDIDYRQIHTEYTSRVPDKVTRIKLFFSRVFSFEIFAVLDNAS